MPKYLLLKHYRGGPEPHRPVPPMDQWAPEDVEAHMAFLRHVSGLLEENGEYVDAQALTPARTWVRYGGPDAAPVTTDGPLPETSDLVAGWYMIDVDPLVQRLPARAGLGGDVGRELARALVRLAVDHVPARHEIAGLGQRAVGGDWRGVRAAVAHPGARRRERLRVDVLAVLLEQLADVLEEGHVRLHVLGGPLVHRGHGTVRLRAAAVVLEEQVLRHGGLLVSWAAPVVALHLVSGAGQSFSTCNHSSSSETVA